eukprot:30919-Pelagococcus_subviridis.AAC.11
MTEGAAPPTRRRRRRRFRELSPGTNYNISIHAARFASRHASSSVPSHDESSPGRSLSSMSSLNSSHIRTYASRCSARNASSCRLSLVYTYAWTTRSSEYASSSLSAFSAAANASSPRPGPGPPPPPPPPPARPPSANVTSTRVSTYASSSNQSSTASSRRVIPCRTSPSTTSLIVVSSASTAG